MEGESGADCPGFRGRNNPATRGPSPTGRSAPACVHNAPAMSLPVLYSFRRCPYAMRARLALRQAAQRVELREVALRAKPAELLALSPKATVPVLQLSDGQVLEQSLDIMRWALARHDPEGWLTAGDAAEQAALIALNDGPFKRLLDAYKYPQRQPAGEGGAPARDAALALLLLPLERALQARGFALADRPGLADMALLPFVRQFAQVDAAWFEQEASLPRLRAWLRALTGTPLFDAVMAPRWAPWLPGQEPVFF